MIIIITILSLLSLLLRAETNQPAYRFGGPRPFLIIRFEDLGSNNSNSTSNNSNNTSNNTSNSNSSNRTLVAVCCAPWDFFKQHMF